MDLTGWIVVWVLVTSVAVVLGYARMTIGMHDVLGMKIEEADAGKFYEKQQAITAKLKRLDRFGITATVLSAASALVILVLWAMQSAGGR